MTLPDIRKVEVRGKRVLVRAGLNVPIQDGVVADNFRIRRALPTINWLREEGAKVIVIAHIGRSLDESLRPVRAVLGKEFPVTFCESLDKQAVESVVKQMNNGDVVLCENLRSTPQEQENNNAFAEFLASVADIYVNDAFAVSHRAHASIVGIPKYLPHYAGLSLLEEVRQLSCAFEPARPALAILAGAKFETKLPLITRVLPEYDRVYIGGALATDFYKARGYEVGDSLVSDDRSGILHLLYDEKVFIPPDVVVTKDGKEESKKATDVEQGEIIVDAGPETRRLITEQIHNASFVLWNGPFGKFEDGFSKTTDVIAEALARSNAVSIVGGGDSVAAISRLGLENSFSFVSTGGGAMIQFIAQGTLPGIEALLQ